MGSLAMLTDAVTRATGRGPARPRVLRACDAVGARVLVRGHVHVENLGRMVVGADARLDATPMPTHLVTGPRGELEIGERVRIGHGCGIVAHASVRIGHGASLGAFVMVLDTDFHVAGAHDAEATPTPIEIGPGARLGNNVVVLRGSVIGAGARIAPGSVVSGVVPPGTEVAGVPARPVASAGAATANAASTTIEERVVAVVAAVLGTTALDVGARLELLPTWDSLTSLNLLLSLETAFGIELAPNDVAGGRTLGDLVRVVAERRP